MTLAGIEAITRPLMDAFHTMQKINHSRPLHRPDVDFLESAKAFTEAALEKINSEIEKENKPHA